MIKIALYLNIIRHNPVNKKVKQRHFRYITNFDFIPSLCRKLLSFQLI